MLPLPSQHPRHGIVSFLFSTLPLPLPLALLPLALIVFLRQLGERQPTSSTSSSSSCCSSSSCFGCLMI